MADDFVSGLIEGLVIGKLLSNSRGAAPKPKPDTPNPLYMGQFTY